MRFFPVAADSACYRFQAGRLFSIQYAASAHYFHVVFSTSSDWGRGLSRWLAHHFEIVLKRQIRASIVKRTLEFGQSFIVPRGSRASFMLPQIEVPQGTSAPLQGFIKAAVKVVLILRVAGSKRTQPFRFANMPTKMHFFAFLPKLLDRKL